MCTIVAWHRVCSFAPLLVAANRDEWYARPSSAPEILGHGSGGPFVGGRDLEHGGTWLGVTASGFFVALANQHGEQHRPRAPRSRGSLVVHLLEAGDVARARAALESVDATQFASFNVLFGDASGLYVAYGRRDEARVRLEALAPGIVVLCNDSLGSPRFPKAERARVLAESVRDASDFSMAFPLLGALLADHVEPPASASQGPALPASFDPALAARLQALCVHTPAYGTRSASALCIQEGHVERYWYADGPPCRTAWTDVTTLLHDGGDRGA
ncbi:MAG: NRDE family protein [Myxococcales bacterium]|nr:NRDE family protein [Myxococcales bacterium]